jgi:hypothetical protein
MNCRALLNFSNWFHFHPFAHISKNSNAFYTILANRDNKHLMDLNSSDFEENITWMKMNLMNENDNMNE